jgi:hypothetical protein
MSDRADPIAASPSPVAIASETLRPARRLPLGGAADALEREAAVAASTVVARGRGLRTPRISPDAVTLRRQGAPGKRAAPGTSSQIKTGKLALWDYVVYDEHVRLGNRVFAKGQVIGSWPWLTNNPGDITVDLTKPKNRAEERRAFGWGAYEGKAASTGHILLAIFPDMATGEEALKKLFTEPDYAKLTIAGAIQTHLGRPESRVPGVDDPDKYARRVQERLDKLGVKVNVQTDRLADLAARGLLGPVAQGFGRAEGVENVGVTYRCSGRDKTDDAKIPQTVRNLRLFKNLPDEAPAEIRELLGCAAEVQRMAATGGGPVAAPPAVEKVLRSQGQPLDPRERRVFEPRFGHDFGSVRVHADAAAAESAAAVGALAYTVGRSVVFGAGRYRPETSAGKLLLAHELAHVVQQHGGSAEGASAESRARVAGRRVAGGGSVSRADVGGAPVSVQRADEESEQRQPTAAPGPGGASTQTLESFDVDRPPGTKPWKLDQLSRKIAAGFAASKQAWIEVVAYFDPSSDFAAGEAGAAVARARSRVDVVRRALIEWAVPRWKIKTSIVDTSLGDPRPPGSVPRQVDIVLHSPQATAPSQASPPSIWLVIVVPPPDEPTAEQIFRQPPPPIVLDAPASLAELLLRQVGKDVNKLLDSPLALPAAWVISKLPAEWHARKEIREGLRDLWKPSKAPPLTDVGTFADPGRRDVEGQQKEAREAMPKTVAKAFLYAGQAAVPAPPRDPVGTTFFIRLPAINLP